MGFRLRFRNLLVITHLSVLVFGALFVGFATYSLTKDYFERRSFSEFPQISEKAGAEEAKREYAVFEKRELLAARPGGHDRERVSGFVRDLETLEDRIVYSFVDDPNDERLRDTEPRASILSNGKIFLNGVSDLRFAVLDSFGNNLSSNFRFLGNRDFPAGNVLFGSANEYIYTYGPSKKIGDDTRQRIYIKKTNAKDTVISETFPFGSEFWLKPLGWNSAFGAFYVERLALSPAPAQLWKIAGKKASPIRSVTGTMHASVRVCPQQNYAVYISAPVDPTDGKYGTQGAPSKLVVADLTADTSTELYASDQLLTNLSVSCGTKRIIVREGNRFLQIDTASRNLPLPVFRGTVLYFSEQGGHAVIKENRRFYIVNLKNGERSEIGEEARYTVVGLMTE